MRTLSSLCLLLFTSISIANGIDDKCPQHVTWGAPKINDTNVQYLCRIGYAVNYSYKTKAPYYVVEHVTKAHLNGPETRKNDFREDPELPLQYRSTLPEWAGSGYDRGHVAPAADFTYSVQAMSESFLLSNMMAQNPNNNRGIWKTSEEFQRNAALKYGEVYIISGPIFISKSPKMMKSVTVPDGMFKIIIDAKNKKSIAFRFDNRKYDDLDLNKNIVSISDIEKETGINFNPKLPVDYRTFEQTKGDLKYWQ